MNIISDCYSVLFREHGDNLFSSPLVKQAEREWGRALSEYQQMDRLLQTGHVGEAVTPPGPAIRIPAGSLQFVQATCNQGPGPALGTVLLEPLPYGKGRLPMNLLISSALLTVSRGTVNIPVVNVAKKHLEAAATAREQRQPPTTTAILPVGTLVYRKNHVLGRRKFQDVWESTVYQVVKCLDNVGTVYKIQSRSNPEQQKTVHRSELRPITERGVLVSEPLVAPPPPRQRDETPPLGNASEDEDSNSSLLSGFISSPCNVSSIAEQEPAPDPSPQRLALCPWKNLQVSQRAIHPLLKGQKQPSSSCWDQR
ncbi:hypothetical protein JOB18_023444 [Solea senegalensis]|uniref:Uncharacterized protein n=1 Tax=Solea senegalensis TaxID=28829 RepID=A0AAV6SIQ2_SOLSE|nr:hypothetical protein JOB18_023444 [Solea senegalensis]